MLEHMYKLTKKECKMFRIPNFYQEQVSFQSAWKTMSNFGGGDCLAGMEELNLLWEQHCATGDCDNDFFDNWLYEVNAFNAVCENMGPIFAEAE